MMRDDRRLSVVRTREFFVQPSARPLMVSKRVGRCKPLAIAGPDDAMIMKTALRILHCLTLGLRTKQAVVRPKCAPQEAHPAKVGDFAFEKAYRRLLSLVPNFFLHLFPAFVVPLVISGYIQDGNGPVFEQVYRGAAKADIASKNEYVGLVRRLNQPLARELAGEKL